MMQRPKRLLDEDEFAPTDGIALNVPTSPLPVLSIPTSQTRDTASSSLPQRRTSMGMMIVLTLTLKTRPREV